MSKTIVIVGGLSLLTASFCFSAGVISSEEECQDLLDHAENKIKEEKIDESVIANTVAHTVLVGPMKAGCFFNKN